MSAIWKVWFFYVFKSHQNETFFFFKFYLNSHFFFWKRNSKRIRGQKHKETFPNILSTLEFIRNIFKHLLNGFLPNFSETFPNIHVEHNWILRLSLPAHIWKLKWASERANQIGTKNEWIETVRVVGGIGIRRGRGVGPWQLRVALPVRRRTPHPRLDLLQSPPLQRLLPLRTFPVTFLCFWWIILHTLISFFLQCKSFRV